MRIYNEEQILEHIAAHAGQWHLTSEGYLRRVSVKGIRLCPLGSLDLTSYGPEAEAIEDQATPLEYRIMMAADGHYHGEDQAVDRLRGKMLVGAGILEWGVVA